MDDKTRIVELVKILRRVSRECYGRYCDNDNDNFLHDTHWFIEENLQRICGEGKQ